MSRTIELFFSMLSPWTYLGDAYLNRIAERHGVTVNHRPMPLSAVFPETGGLPLPKRHKSRQDYRLIELQRWRDARDVPLNLQPRHWPFAPTLVDCTVIAATLEGYDPSRFVSSGMRAVWSEDMDLADPATVKKIAENSGLPADDLLARAQSDDIGVRYRANADEAIAAGIFGAPTVRLDGENFWGQDRYELLEAALSSRREPYRVPA